jgi:hypothetical protein
VRLNLLICHRRAVRTEAATDPAARPLEGELRDTGAP